VVAVAPLGLRHAAFGAALLVLFGSWLPVVAIAAALLGVHYWFSDQIALSAMRGELAGPEEEPRLYAILTRLCAQADMPKPALAVAATDVPRALAAGRTPSHAVLCVTTGLIDELTDDEVEAVLARELSRLAHRDVVVTTIAPLMAMFAGLLIRIPFHTSPLGGSAWQTDPALGTELAVAVLLVYVLGFLLVRMLSRRRELAADRDSATLTGRPTSLARALIKLDSAGTAIPTTDLRIQAALSRCPAIPALRRGRSLFSAHPNLHTRLNQLTSAAAVRGSRSSGTPDLGQLTVVSCQRAPRVRRYRCRTLLHRRPGR
jgi:heat shock protein HtpX